MQFTLTVVLCTFIVPRVSPHNALLDELGELLDEARVFDEDSMTKIVTDINQKSAGQPNHKVGERVAKWNPRSKINPEELGDYYQGDILNPGDDEAVRNGVIGDHFRWPRGIVYYRIKGDFNKAQIKHIYRCMRIIEESSCIRFYRHAGEKDYVTIANDSSGCWASVGRSGGEQHLNMQTPNCFRRFGTMLHELLHVLGFVHEHSRTDRDRHIAINWRNVRDDALGQFEKDDTFAFGLPYDYGSVLHYSAFAFSRNKRQTIIPKLQRPGPTMGQRTHLSVNDILKLNAMYKCRGRFSYV